MTIVHGSSSQALSNTTLSLEELDGLLLTVLILWVTGPCSQSSSDFSARLSAHRCLAI